STFACSVKTYSISLHDALPICADMDPAAQVKTLAHELGHVLLHGPDAGEARQHRGIGEVEAESVALMVGAAHGMDTSGYTVPYRSEEHTSELQSRLDLVCRLLP